MPFERNDGSSGFICSKPLVKRILWRQQDRGTVGQVLLNLLDGLDCFTWTFWFLLTIYFSILHKHFVIFSGWNRDIKSFIISIYFYTISYCIFSFAASLWDENTAVLQTVPWICGPCSSIIYLMQVIKSFYVNPLNIASSYERTSKANLTSSLSPYSQGKIGLLEISVLYLCLYLSITNMSSSEEYRSVFRYYLYSIYTYTNITVYTYINITISTYGTLLHLSLSFGLCDHMIYHHSFFGLLMSLSLTPTTTQYLKKNVYFYDLPHCSF